MKKNLLAVITSILLVVIFSFTIVACDTSILPPEKVPCKVTLSYDAEKGSVKIKDKNGAETTDFTSGDTVKVEATANDGFKIMSFKVANMEKGLVDGAYSFEISKDTEISVEFTALYSVTALYNEAYGKVEITDISGAEKEWFDNRENANIKVTPAEGYTLTNLSINGASVTYSNGYSYTVNGTDAVVRAEFYPTNYLPLQNALKVIGSTSYTVNISYTEYEQYDVFVTDSAVYSCAAEGDDDIIILDFFDEDIEIDDGSESYVYLGYYTEKDNVYAFATMDGELTRLGLVPEKLENLSASFCNGVDLTTLFDYKSAGVYELKEGIDIAQTLTNYFMERDNGNFYIDYLAESFTGLTVTLSGDGKLETVIVPYGEYGEQLVFTYSDIGTTECELDLFNLPYAWASDLGTYSNGTIEVVVDRDGIKYNGEYAEPKYDSWGLGLAPGESANIYIEIDGEPVYLRISNLELYLLVDDGDGNYDENKVTRLIYVASEIGTIPNSFVGIWEGDGYIAAPGTPFVSHYRVEIVGTDTEVTAVYVSVDDGEKISLTITDFVNDHLYAKESADTGYNFNLSGDTLMFLKYGGLLGLMNDMGELHKLQAENL